MTPTATDAPVAIESDDQAAEVLTQDVLAEDVLVEDVSIDGMCGVY
jgi:mycofactocin precursor